MLDDDPQIVGARGRASTSARRHLLGAAADHGQRAADLVRDAGREHADGDQLLGAHQLVLEVAQLGPILDQREGAHAQLVVAHRARRARGTGATPVATERSSWCAASSRRRWPARRLSSSGSSSASHVGARARERLAQRRADPDRPQPIGEEAVGQHHAPVWRDAQHAQRRVLDDRLAGLARAGQRLGVAQAPLELDRLALLAQDHRAHGGHRHRGGHGRQDHARQHRALALDDRPRRGQPGHDPAARSGGRRAPRPGPPGVRRAGGRRARRASRCRSRRRRCSRSSWSRTLSAGVGAAARRRSRSPAQTTPAGSVTNRRADGQRRPGDGAQEDRGVAGDDDGAPAAAPACRRGGRTARRARRRRAQRLVALGATTSGREAQVSGVGAPSTVSGGLGGIDGQDLERAVGRRRGRWSRYCGTTTASARKAPSQTRRSVADVEVGLAPRALDQVGRACACPGPARRAAPRAPRPRRAPAGASRP